MGFTGDGLRTDGIGHFLSGHFLTAPANQRSYAWESDKVEDFWNDIVRAMEETPEDYFIGSIVPSRTDGEALEVVGGQQRLATTTIILGAIRDFFLEKVGEDRAQLTESKYLIATNEDTLEPEPRLALSTDDNLFFRTNVVFRSKGVPRENPIGGDLPPKKSRSRRTRTSPTRAS